MIGPPGLSRGSITFWMDEFYAGARPHDTEKIMGVIRSRNISMVPILQSVAQLKALFKTEKWEVIMDNCPTLVFLGAGAGAIETHKYISELLGSMTIDTIGDGRHGKQWNANFGKAGAPLMTPQQVKRMDRKHCIIFTEEERPIYDRKALPWEDNKYYDEAMKLNQKSPDNGYIHTVEVLTSETGETVSIRTDKHSVIESSDIPPGAKIMTLTDKDIAGMNLNADPAAALLSKLRAFKAVSRQNKSRIREITLPRDRDLSGDLFVVMSRYYSDLSNEERSFLIEKLEEGWNEDRIKAFLGMSYSEMKKAATTGLSLTK